MRRDQSPVTVQVRGRHDPVVVIRAVPVVEAMAAIALTDQIFAGMHAKMEDVKDFYG